jgi:hypothetical protein
MFPEAQPHRKDGRFFSELPAYALTFQDEHGTARIATETTGATSAIVCYLSPVDAVFLEHFANRKPCLIGMEACGGAQHCAPRSRRNRIGVVTVPRQNSRLCEERLSGLRTKNVCLGTRDCERE